MFEDDDPVLNAFRDRIRQRSRVSSILNEQRAINQERNQGLADDFDNKFSGSLQEALSGYGDTSEGQVDQSGRVVYEDDRTNDLMSADISVDAGLQPAQGVLPQRGPLVVTARA